MSRPGRRKGRKRWRERDWSRPAGVVDAAASASEEGCTQKCKRQGGGGGALSQSTLRRRLLLPLRQVRQPAQRERPFLAPLSLRRALAEEGSADERRHSFVVNYHCQSSCHQRQRDKRSVTWPPQRAQRACPTWSRQKTVTSTREPAAVAVEPGLLDSSRKAKEAE